MVLPVSMWSLGTTGCCSMEKQGELLLCACLVPVLFSGCIWYLAVVGRVPGVSGGWVVQRGCSKVLGLVFIH